MPHKSKEEKERIELIEKIRKEIDSFPRLKRGFSEERIELIDLHQAHYISPYCGG